MSESIIAAKKPAVIELEAGTHYWCRCGRSASQPLCDGSHAGTGIEPLAFSLSEKRKVALCQCKRTTNPPYCDGTHAKLA